MTHTNIDGASPVSNANENMERLLDTVTELKGDIGAHLTRLSSLCGDARGSWPDYDDILA